MGREGYATGARRRAATPAHDQRSTTDRRAAARERLAVRRGRARSARRAWRAGRPTSPVSNEARWRRCARVGLLEPRRDLGEPAVPGDERRAAAGGGLGGNHAERLREDRRHDRGVGEREQVREVAVLERAGEEDAAAGAAARARPGSRRTRRSPHARRARRAPRAAAGRPCSRSASRSRRRSARRRRGRPRAAAALPSSGSRSSRVPGVGRVGARLGEQVGERLVPALRAELVDVDAGRHLVDALDVTR